MMQIHVSVFKYHKHKHNQYTIDTYVQYTIMWKATVWLE